MVQQDLEKTSFISLPNEIHTTIIRKLEKKDRKNLAAVNDRFKELVKIAGYRRFKTVYCNTHGMGFTADSDSEYFDRRFDRNSPLHDIASFFHYASANSIIFAGQFTEDSEKIVHSVLKTLYVVKLRISIYNEIDLKLFYDLHCRKSIKEMHVQFFRSGLDLNPVKRMLLNLPIKDKLEITIRAPEQQAEQTKSLFDDQVLIHLANISAKIIIRGTYHTAVSARGLANIFEIFGNGQRARKVEFEIAPDELNLFRSRLDLSKFENQVQVSGKEIIKHRDTGAIMCWGIMQTRVFITTEFNNNTSH